MSEEQVTDLPPPPPPPPPEDYKDKYFRLLAEMENMRKRVQKEKQESVRYAIDNILAEILMPLDQFESALKHAAALSDEIKNWATGFQMILGQFKTVLEENGVLPFISEGTQFDPFKHEAVESEETDTVPEGTVLQEFIRGYKCGDRVIRPARVKVSKLIKKEENI